MLRRLFSRSSLPPEAAPVVATRAPAGVRIYAIGDIHGRADLLDELLARIDGDDSSRSAAETHLIFLGDLVDRGPESRAVVDRVKSLVEGYDNIRHLKGNHEEVFLLALEGDAQALRLFSRIGGRETLASYGVTDDEFASGSFQDLAAVARARVPEDHRRFLESGEDVIVYGDYAFVHAGIRPGVPLEAQKGADLRWIRDEFLDYDGLYDKLIVHGHTITETVDEQPHRIGIDTGAFETGRLTALALEGDRRWYLQTEPAAIAA